MRYIKRISFLGPKWNKLAVSVVNLFVSLSVYDHEVVVAIYSRAHAQGAKRSVCPLSAQNLLYLEIWHHIGV